MRKVLKIALFLLFLCLVAYSSGIIHEYGHAFSALACGAEVRAAVIAPGIIFYPRFGFYRWQLGEDPIGWCSYEDPDVPWKAYVG